MAKTYKIRKFQNGRNKDGQPFINYSLTIPTHIAEKLPADIQYECVITDEGLLFRPASEQEQVVELPAWAKNAAASNGSGEPPKRKRPSRKKEPQPEVSATE